MGRFKIAEDPNQGYLLPPSMKDWLPEGHLAWFISDTVDQLDIDGFVDEYRICGKGELPYPPRVMLKILIYAYCVGVFSSRKIAQHLEESVPFRILGSGLFPGHRTICRFRERHLDQFAGVFVQVVQIAKSAGLVKLGTVAVDGSKVKANASRHKAMSYARMQEEEERLKKEIREIAAAAAGQDALEDGQFGPDFRGDELPEELQRRESRLRTIQEAKQRLEERKAAEEAVRAAKDAKSVEDGTADPGRKKRSRPRKYEPGKPKPKDQENFTDPDSRIMPHGRGRYEQSYNTQIAVDDESQIVVAEDVSQNAADSGSLQPMVAETKANTGEAPKTVLADSGYKSEENFRALTEDGIEVYVPLGREGKSGARPIGKDLVETRRMASKMQTEEARERYRKRKHIVEPVFGWVKHVLGFRSFSLRGLEKVAGEWTLVCLALNLRRMKGKVAS